MTHRLVKHIRAKLADQRGDSLVEALVAILIAALGATMLATMVMAAANVAARSEQTLNASYKAETSLNTSPGAETSISVVIPESSAVAGGSAAQGTTVETNVVLYASDMYEYYRDGDS